MTAPTADDVLVTADGFEQLRAELHTLQTVGRAELTEHLRELRSDGDPDNPALYELMEEQAQLEQRIALLDTQLAAARVVKPGFDGSAGIGSRVRVRYADSGELAEYELVGPIESDVGSGRVSVGAPVGRALVGARRGEHVSVEAPRGSLRLEVLSVHEQGRR